VRIVRPQRDGVQGRVPVGLGQVLDQLGEPEMRLVHAGRLVEPEAPRDAQAQREPGQRQRNDGCGGHAGGHVAGRARDAPAANRERRSPMGPAPCAGPPRRGAVRPRWSSVQLVAYGSLKRDDPQRTPRALLATAARPKRPAPLV